MSALANLNTFDFEDGSIGLGGPLPSSISGRFPAPRPGAAYDARLRGQWAQRSHLPRDRKGAPWMQDITLPLANATAQWVREVLCPRERCRILPLLMHESALQHAPICASFRSCGPRGKDRLSLREPSQPPGPPCLTLSSSGSETTASPAVRNNSSESCFPWDFDPILL